MTLYAITHIKKGTIKIMSDYTGIYTTKATAEHFLEKANTTGVRFKITPIQQSKLNSILCS